jgi:hypothetical protein
VLGGGVSLQQAELIDEWNDTLTEAEFAAIPDLEETDDWTGVSLVGLDMDNISHLDAEGLRYYLPAFMLYLLDHYEGGADWATGIIGAVDQRRRHPHGFLEILTPEQGRAIARYVGPCQHSSNSIARTRRPSSVRWGRSGGGTSNRPPVACQDFGASDLRLTGDTMPAWTA